ncbi:DUF6185 family protein [Spongiactinospora sp. TRM90649]|uniref:DUF6185 family protein n=1 Tax=Spongiactinospora sp. TRM90649 TaxID=3031114 RepID=UPI0023F83C73|nr:DUF6185 family protein [Spongiactinospora sp. TRM90649]MDF5751203.1 DUF6185 family protein [Spongiactinospora sp. TRM90649]
MRYPDAGGLAFTLVPDLDTRGQSEMNEPVDQMLRTILLFAVLTTAGLVADARTLRRLLPPWSRVGRFMLDIYRLETLPSQATFLLAQLAALLAIVQSSGARAANAVFVRGQGGEPPFPSIDPFQMPRPP